MSKELLLLQYICKYDTAGIYNLGLIKNVLVKNLILSSNIIILYSHYVKVNCEIEL